MPEFELLCDNLHLTPELEDADQLYRLKTWWHTKVSSDISFDGSLKDQYKHYLDEAKRYLNVFLTNQFTHMNAIQYASLHGYDHYIAQLNEAPTAFDKEDKDGMTPLHWAAFKGHVHTISALLNKGANPEKPNKNSQLPIYTTLLVPIKRDDNLYSHKKTIFNLLRAIAPESIKHQDKSGDSVCHLMAGDSEFNDLLEQTLKTSPALIAAPNHLKQFPIHTAILNNKMNNARLLLESNTGVDMHPDRDNRVALHYAAKYGSDEMLNLCIATSKDINVRDAYNKTPLIIAAEAGNQEAITTLLHHHANPDLVDYEQQTWHDHMKHRQQNKV